MAGSWAHMTTKSGKFCGTRYLENLGDCYEALEECYGMVQLLAQVLADARAAGDPAGADLQALRREIIAQVSEHYEDGLKIGGMASRRIFGE
jgi:hypothetical protein